MTSIDLTESKNEELQHEESESTSGEGVMTSLVITVVLALTVLSYRDWFFFVPIVGNGLNVISVLQVFSAIGWVSLILVPPFMIWQQRGFAGVRKVIFLASALLWPVATILIAFATYITLGKFYLDYLKDSPIFLFMDLLAPGYYLMYWRSNRN
jgi:hypothetical protein